MNIHLFCKVEIKYLGLTLNTITNLCLPVGDHWLHIISKMHFWTLLRILRDKYEFIDGYVKLWICFLFVIISILLGTCNLRVNILYKLRREASQLNDKKLKWTWTWNYIKKTLQTFWLIYRFRGTFLANILECTKEWLLLELENSLPYHQIFW